MPKRPHGVRAQDWAAQQQFEHQKKLAPPVAVGEPIMVPIACPCSFRPYPHIVAGVARERHICGERA